MIGPMSLLRTITATHFLSTADKGLPGLGTRRRVPAVESSAHTPLSVLLPAGCRTCASLLAASRSSAPGHVGLGPPRATFDVRLDSIVTKSPLLPSNSTICPRNGPKMGENGSECAQDLANTPKTKNRSYLGLRGSKPNSEGT